MRMDCAPSAYQLAFRVHAGRGGHETDPDAGDQEQHCAEYVEQHAQGYVQALPGRELLPGIEIIITDEHFAVHHDKVQPPGGPEDLHHVVDKFRIEQRKTYEK